MGYVRSPAASDVPRGRTNGFQPRAGSSPLLQDFRIRQLRQKLQLFRANAS
jgi:hypothetical protein